MTQTRTSSNSGLALLAAAVITIPVLSIYTSTAMQIGRYISNYPQQPTALTDTTSQTQVSPEQYTRD